MSLGLRIIQIVEPRGTLPGSVLIYYGYTRFPISTICNNLKIGGNAIFDIATSASRLLGCEKGSRQCKYFIGCKTLATNFGALVLGWLAGW